MTTGARSIGAIGVDARLELGLPRRHPGDDAGINRCSTLCVREVEVTE